MPKFLEDQLRQEYGDDPHKIFGTMNKIGAMRGNKTTPKGRAMEAKHNAKIKPMADGGVAGALPYQTKLNPQQEAEFQNYVKLRPGYAFDPLPQSDYDERGQWLAQKQGLDPGGNWAAPGSSLLEQKSDGPHGSDVWKTPYHRTFSNESKYAMTGREPRWTQGGLLQTPTGATVADESDEGKKSALRGLKGVKKMFTGGVVRRPDYNRPYDPNDPEQQYLGMPPPPMPQESMDPTAPMAPPPMPTELSRFDAQPDDEAGSGPPPAPSPAEQGPPPQPDAIGRDPRYRNLAIQQKETQDEAPPPMPGLRNQGTAQQQAIDYAQKILMDPKHPGQFKQPSVLQNVLGAIAPRFNMHPNLTRQYQNYELLKSRADEERKMQQAQSAEEIKKDTLETNRTARDATAQNQRSAAEDRRVKAMTADNLEEVQPGETYRGTVNIGGQTYGVIRPEVLAERKKKAEQVNWLEVPKPLQAEYGLAPRAPKETIDTALRLLEMRAGKEAADAMRRELAAQQDQLRRDLADQSDRTRRDIASENNAARKDVAATTPHGTFSPIYDKEGNITEFYNPLTQEHAPAPSGATKPLGADAQKRIASARATMDAAQRAIQLIQQIKAEHPNYVGAGPISRTVAGVRSATSTEPDTFGAADTALESVAALQPGQHGFRSIQALNQFKQSLGIDPRTGKATGGREWLKNPAKAIAGLQEVARFNEALAKDVRGGGAATAVPSVATAEDYLQSIGHK